MELLEITARRTREQLGVQSRRIDVLAPLWGLSRSSVHKALRGGDMRLHTLDRIATMLGVAPYDLLRPLRDGPVPSRPPSSGQPASRRNLAVNLRRSLTADRRNPRDLSDASGISLATLYRIIGQRSDPRLSTLERLSHAACLDQPPWRLIAPPRAAG
jgi:DNA-binding Xre family transcriptional regulator